MTLTAFSAIYPRRGAGRRHTGLVNRRGAGVAVALTAGISPRKKSPQ